MNIVNTTSSLPPSKAKRVKRPINQSIVWDIFTRIEHIDLIDSKVQCNYYSKLYEYHYKNVTSSMPHQICFSFQASFIREKNHFKDKSPSKLGVWMDGKGSNPQD